MIPQKKYSIEYQGLTLGEHHFEFEVGNDLFAMYEESEVKKGQLEVEVYLVKHSTFMELEVEIIGEVEVACDRCLDEYRQPIDYFGELIVKISAEQGEDDGDVIWLNPGEDKLSLAQYIYESVILSLPFPRIHPHIEDCNQDMIARFSMEG